MSETTILHRVHEAAARLGWTLWRNNVGRGWVGRAYKWIGRDLLVMDARPVDFGLCKGSADLIGIKPVTITQDMVGKVVGVFAGVEVKTPSGRLSPEQERWLEFVSRAGGAVVVTRNQGEIE